MLNDLFNLYDLSSTIVRPFVTGQQCGDGLGDTTAQDNVQRPWYLHIATPMPKSPKPVTHSLSPSKPSWAVSAAGRATWPMQSSLVSRPAAPQQEGAPRSPRGWSPRGVMSAGTVCQSQSCVSTVTRTTATHVTPPSPGRLPRPPSKSSPPHWLWGKTLHLWGCGEMHAWDHCGGSSPGSPAGSSSFRPRASQH